VIISYAGLQDIHVRGPKDFLDELLNLGDFLRFRDREVG